MKTKKQAARIVEILKEIYPVAACSLNYIKDYELLFSVRLSAQCTDARVNLITPGLFSDYPTLKSFADADLEALEQAVKPCGFYHMKAKDIKLSAQMLLSDFGGRVPDTMQALLSLPGVGRKTANLILGDLYDKPGIVADTHCIRISNRLGLCKTTDPYKVELALDALIEKKEQGDFCHRLVYFGRDRCTARSPKCAGCPLAHLCDYVKHKG